MMGFLYDEWDTDDGPFPVEYLVSRFVSAATFRSPACEDRQDCRVLDSRHGLVLFYTPTMDAAFLVCDLVTGYQREIHADPKCEDIMWWEEDDDEYKYEHIRCKAAVLCSRDRCDHLNCHGGPFRVALVGSGVSNEGVLEAVATVYSSETGEWSEVISVENNNFVSDTGHIAVLGNKVYAPCAESDSVAEYSISEQKISVIDAPCVDNDQPYIDLMGVEDGLLLFVSVVDTRLYLWSMEAGPRRTTEWARRRSIELGSLLGVSAVGFAEGVSVIFLSTEDGLHTIELNSGKDEKVHESRRIEKVVPYMSFYTGVWGQLLILE